MNNWNQILTTAFLTVISGALVFCLGQIVLNFFIEPIQKLDECRGKICDTLIFYRNIYMNPGTLNKEKEKEVSDKIRELASILLSRKAMIRGYDFFVKYKIIPSNENIILAHKSLIGISNSIPASGKKNIDCMIEANIQREQEIKNALKIEL